jgi:hypothetical protein
MAAAFGVGVMALVTGHAQQNTKGGTLTAMDYIQIQQLVNRYAYAVDTGADIGRMYAGLFAPDGAFLQRGGVRHTGPEALAAVGYRNSRGPQSVFHYLMSHAIEPTADGARGKELLVQFVIGDNGEPSRVFGGGHYDDVYERTKDGWRFKQRQFIPSQSGYELAVPTTDVPELHKVSQASPKSTAMTFSIWLRSMLYRSATALTHRDIYLLESTDRGRSFRGSRVQPWEIGACPMTSMSIASSSTARAQSRFACAPRKAYPMTSFTCSSRQARTQRPHWMQASRLTAIAGWLRSGAGRASRGKRPT